MSKYKTTRKAVREKYIHVISVGNGSIQNLLKYEYPVAYATRVEGWAFDVYDFGDTALISGYAPIGKEIDWNLRKEYDDKAKEICEKYDWGEYEKKRDELHELALEFIEKANQRKRRTKL